ncbi:conserved domain protein [Roseobacter denitrificans OCh 114]|uniref:Conserved domain protein n=1 Tax=Roseobacter denitrificans (strain ATCC 33942 / OCh 114) TaxID=375451 RepID=Q165B6_ROSDO|nr:conserved domain protein [Roseobacter denitrificans OCh 114]
MLDACVRGLLDGPYGKSQRISHLKAILGAFCVSVMLANGAAAQDDTLRLAVPEVLETSGFMQFLVPRFSLKTGVRIDRDAAVSDADMAFGAQGTAVFEGLGQVWHLSHVGDARAERFLTWLQSDVGIRTIESYASPQGDVFSVPTEEVAAVEAVVLDGDAMAGETLSLALCGRCHVVNESNRMKGMGSTPSFALMRSFEDWHTRFATFHLLKPHPSFTQIEGVTAPFDESRPSPMVPMTMTPDELDAILAYVSGIAPADLGAPLKHQ